MNESPSVEHTLQCLIQKYPLPLGWTLEDLHQEQFLLEDFSMDVFGVCFKKDEQIVFGSAAGSLERAYFELQERMAAFNAKATFCVEADCKASLSNGLAAGVDVHSTQQRAYNELLERDAILRSWYGWAKPQLLPVEANIMLPAKLY